MSDETSGTTAGRGASRGAHGGRLYKQRDPRTGRLCSVWWIDYSIRGKRYRESAKTTVMAEARDLLHQRIAEHKKGSYVSNANRVTLDQLVDGLRIHYRLKGNRSLDRAEQALVHVVKFFGGETLALDLTADRLEKYADTRMQTVGKATVRYELACLRKAMNAAVKNGRLASRPVFPDMGKGSARVGFFEQAELDAVLAELPQVLRPVVRFASITGWRKRECLDLTWDRVDFKAGIVRLDPGMTKNGKGRKYHFGNDPDLAGLLAEQRAYSDAVAKRTGRIVRLVFHREGKLIKTTDTAWHSACKRAGCPGMLFHDLRRTAVRALIRAGVTEKVAMALSGHETRTIFDRYNITSEQDEAEAAAKAAAARRAGQDRASDGARAPIRTVTPRRSAACFEANLGGHVSNVCSDV